MMPILTTLCFISALITSIHCQCPVAGCQANRCYCVDSTKDLKKEPEAHFIQSPLQLSNRGCLANINNIVCPLEEQEAAKTKSGCLTLHYLSPAEHTWWRCSHINNTISLPIIDVSGDVIASDGYTLSAYHADGSIVPPPIPLYPNTGEIVDMLFTNNSLFGMIYKCGLIVAYRPDGTAWASIWINNTQTTNGTFVPLSTPAVKGERLYLLTGFWPTNASSNHNSDRADDESFMIRLYAIDSTTMMVKRLRIAWYHEITVDGRLPDIERHYNSCRYHPPTPSHTTSTGASTATSSGDIVPAQVTVSRDTVIVTFNYKTLSGTASYYTISINDAGASYSVNCAQSSVDNEQVQSLAIVHGRSNYTIMAVQQDIADSTTDKGTLLMVHELPNVCKSPVKVINVSSLLFTDTTVVLTTDLLVIQSTSNNVYVVFGVRSLSDASTYVVSALKVAADHDWSDDGVSVYWNATVADMVTGQVSVWRDGVLGDTVCFSSRNGLHLYK